MASACHVDERSIEYQMIKVFMVPELSSSSMTKVEERESKRFVYSTRMYVTSIAQLCDDETINKWK